jgi:hypothetical protein
MNWAEAVVLIVVVTSVVKMLRDRHLARAGLGAVLVQDELAGHGHAAPSAPPAEIATLRAEIETLRQRVQVLERIATQDRHSARLSDEIEALR